ncbi:MAG TPA: DinB family protein [Trueperaceae bacterium]
MNAYTDRILGYLSDQDPIAVLEASPARLHELFEAFADPDWERSYAPGKWSARDLVAHLADAELGMGFRLRQVLAGAPIQSWDQDAWASRYQRLEPSLAVETFRALRAWNLALLTTFTLDDWLAEAPHPELGPLSVDMMVRMLAGHDLNHLRQLEQIAAGL